MKNTEKNENQVQCNLLRILAVTGAHWDMSQRKRTTHRAIPRAPKIDRRQPNSLMDNATNATFSAG